MSSSSLSPQQSALVLIEFQNEFAKPGGIFHEAVKPVMDSTNMLSNTVALVNRARAVGISILHLAISFSPDFHEVSPQPYGIIKNIVNLKAFVTGSNGVKFVDELTPISTDIVVDGKKGLCGFASTNLEWILRSRGIQNIAIGGFLTNVCVEATMRTAYEKGFQVYTLTDCTAATSAEGQHHAVTNIFPLFSRPVTSTEFIQLFKATA